MLCSDQGNSIEIRTEGYKAQDMKPNKRKAKTVALLIKGLRRSLRSERGSLLMEVVVTLSVFGVLGTAVLGAVQGSYIAKNDFDSNSTVENLIRNQIESAFAETYKAPGSGNYTPVSAVPAGYTITAEPVTFDATSTDVSTVRITVYKEGQLLKTFDTVRTNR